VVGAEVLKVIGMGMGERAVKRYSRAGFARVSVTLFIFYFF